jgi:hypothetical protein
MCFFANESGEAQPVIGRVKASKSMSQQSNDVGGTKELTPSHVEHPSFVVTAFQERPESEDQWTWGCVRNRRQPLSFFGFRLGACATRHIGLSWRMPHAHTRALDMFWFSCMFAMDIVV